MQPFRFGVVLHGLDGLAGWTSTCQEAERLGYDVIHVSDHLGWPAPFPALTAAAQATERVRVGTFVLSSAFWNPTLLAREVVTTDRLTEGRLDVGLGAGHRREAFEAAAVPWKRLDQRIDHIRDVIGALSERYRESAPDPVGRPRPPLLLAGMSDGVLRLGAEQADVVGFFAFAKARPPLGFRIMSAEEMDERVAFVVATAGDRFADIELNVMVRDVIVTDDREAAAERWLSQTPYLDYEGLLATPGVLVGSVNQIAAQLQEWRKRFGFSYISVHEPALRSFAPVISALSGE